MYVQTALMETSNKNKTKKLGEADFQIKVLALSGHTWIFKMKLYTSKFDQLISLSYSYMSAIIYHSHWNR